MVDPRLGHDILDQGLDCPLRCPTENYSLGSSTAGDTQLVCVSINGSGLDGQQLTEKTPLLVLDANVSASVTPLIEEEHQAALDDANSPTKEIVMDELKHILGMSGPLLLTVIMEQIPNTLTMMMIGHTDPERSTEILAAMGLTGLFQMLLISGVSHGIGVALDTVCAQAFGGKRYLEMWLMIQAGVLMFAASLPVLVPIFLNGATILCMLGQDPALAETAWAFLFLNALSLPLVSIYVVQKTILQTQNITGPMATSSVVSYMVSLPSAYVLGFWTPLSYIGVAASSIINYAIKTLFLVPVIKRSPVYQDTWPGWKLKEATQLLLKILPLGFSSMLLVTLQTAGYTVMSIAVGYLPDPAVAITANSIFIQVASFAVTPVMALVVAGAVRTGNALGAGQARRAELVSSTIVGLCFSTAFFGMVIVMCAATPIARAFTNDPDAVDVTVDVFLRVGIAIPIIGATFGIQSIFRACGEQWFCAKLNILFVLVIGAPLGLFFATAMDGGITGLWLGNSLGFLALTVAAGVWLYHMNWEQMVHNARMNSHFHAEVVPTAEVA
ncbi:hypothetical protein Poli38472_002608 [Pythium oligandrum]|uniref:Multidrug and toxic compound extrusion protein n=1 Tax=Pythium oligandrum TaxID=41045 RepID=A0A8K1CHU3_PYTOL|nr:hypothetical protein Poli38472_002608 [Pythium oligandrum]|eukprot:TMW63667.1 hypothetical protein Poli38472_002608 [Pythium oligandrum]